MQPAPMRICGSMEKEKFRIMAGWMHACALYGGEEEEGAIAVRSTATPWYLSAKEMEARMYPAAAWPTDEGVEISKSKCLGPLSSKPPSASIQDPKHHKQPCPSLGKQALHIYCCTEFTFWAISLTSRRTYEYVTEKQYHHYQQHANTFAHIHTLSLTHKTLGVREDECAQIRESAAPFFDVCPATTEYQHIKNSYITSCLPGAKYLASSPTESQALVRKYALLLVLVRDSTTIR